eukprot:767657-Hanusia_phi.AAC.1
MMRNRLLPLLLIFAVNQLLLVDLHILEVQPEIITEFLHYKFLLRLAQDDGGSICPSSRRPPRPMHIVVGIGGEVEADDVAEVGDVDTPRCNLGRHY